MYTYVYIILYNYIYICRYVHVYTRLALAVQNIFVWLCQVCLLNIYSLLKFMIIVCWFTLFRPLWSEVWHYHFYIKKTSHFSRVPSGYLAMCALRGGWRPQGLPLLSDGGERPAQPARKKVSFKHHGFWSTMFRGMWSRNCGWWMLIYGDWSNNI